MKFFCYRARWIFVEEGIVGMAKIEAERQILHREYPMIESSRRRGYPRRVDGRAWPSANIREFWVNIVYIGTSVHPGWGREWHETERRGKTDCSQIAENSEEKARLTVNLLNNFFF